MGTVVNEASPLSRYTVPLRRWWWIVAVVVGVGLLAALITMPAPAREPTAEEIADPSVTFRATHILIRNEAATNPISFDLLLLLARQGELTGRVLEQMEGEVDTADVDDVTLEADEDIGTISVTTTQPTPDLASELATTYAQEIQRLVDERSERELQDRINRAVERQESLDGRIRDLEGEIEELPEDSVDRRLLESELEGLIDEYSMAQSEERSLREQRAGLEPQFETLQEPAPVSTASLDEGVLALPRSPLPRLSVAGVLALLAGGVLVLGIDYVDTRVRTRRDAEDAFGLPVIAQFPLRTTREREADPLPVVSDPSGPTAEAFRSLRLSIQLAPVWKLSGQTPTRNGAAGTAERVGREGDPRTLLVTSSMTGDGKSTLVANLAASYAAAGERVLVVDCDFRRPAVSKLLGVGPGPGLRDLDPAGEHPLSLSDLAVPTAIENVSLVRAGDPGVPPSWFLTLGSVVADQAAQLAHVVIFDSGPLALTTEASTLLPAVDAVLLVARANRVSREQAWDTVEQLARLSAQVAGVVMVGGESARHYGYGYYEVAAKTSRRDKARQSSGWAARSGTRKVRTPRP